MHSIIYFLFQLRKKQAIPRTEGYKADRYVQSLVDADIGIYKGELTNANFLILAVDAYPGANFDVFA